MNSFLSTPLSTPLFILSIDSFTSTESLWSYASECQPEASASSTGVWEIGAKTPWCFFLPPIPWLFNKAMDTHTNTNTYMCICIYIYTYIYIYTHMYNHTHIYIHRCICVYIYIYVCVCVCANTYIHIYILIILYTSTREIGAFCHVSRIGVVRPIPTQITDLNRKLKWKSSKYGNDCQFPQIC